MNEKEISKEDIDLLDIKDGGDDSSNEAKNKTDETAISDTNKQKIVKKSEKAI